MTRVLHAIYHHCSDGLMCSVCVKAFEASEHGHVARMPTRANAFAVLLPKLEKGSPVCECVRMRTKTYIRLCSRACARTVLARWSNTGDKMRAYVFKVVAQAACRSGCPHRVWRACACMRGRDILHVRAHRGTCAHA